MIYITGDTHGNFERVSELCKKFNTSKKDILIILGDVGINYYGGRKDKKLKEKLSRFPITLFCIKGNHENYAENIPTYKVSEFCEGKVFVEQEYPNILFAKDGEIYNFEGKKAIVIGGAYSVDKFYRLAMGFKWFSDEQPSESTKKFVEEQLDRVNWEVDFVLSHTVPLRYEPREWFLSEINQSTVDKSTEEWLDSIFSKLKFEKWYCGHYHGEKVIDNIEFMFKGVKNLI